MYKTSIRDIEVPESEKNGLAYYKNKVNKLSLEYHKSNDRPIDYFERIIHFMQFSILKSQYHFSNI